MARARQFDLETATDAAVDLFWRKGYAATSVRDLCEAMGVQSGSFYAAFASKQACFRVALARYLATQGLPSTPGPAAIRAWLQAIVAPARRKKGCLLVNSAIEGPSLDAATRRFVGERLRAVEEFFARCLGNRPHARSHAALLASTVLSVHVLARSGAPRDQLHRLADAALATAGIAPLDES
ncbi:MAG TPA: helix-turn-helix domain-containing protein [Nannocystaceae bacterium]|nr:helix-turn-helix domain-containing protein [Nannocystaceae bacterium]